MYRICRYMDYYNNHRIEYVATWTTTIPKRIEYVGTWTTTIPKRIKYVGTWTTYNTQTYRICGYMDY